MIERGLKMRTQSVDVWLDTGTIAATLETNRYLLEHGQANRTKREKKDGVEIIPPVFIHASASSSIRSLVRMPPSARIVIYRMPTLKIASLNPE